MTRSARWRYALKPASWPKLLVPALLGQCIGFAEASVLNARALLVGLLFTLCLLAFIVFLNDWGDRDVDAIKRRLFPDGCSPKTVPDGILPAVSLLRAGLLSGALALGLAFGAEGALDRPRLGLFGVASLSLFVFYSLPPLRLNYRGGGELLEALGVGLALPSFHVYLQSGVLTPRALSLLAPFVLLSLSSATASGLADEVSDRQGGKRTYVTVFGNAAGRRMVELCLAAGGLGWLLLTIHDAAVFPLFTLAPPLLVLLYEGARLHRLGPAATTNEFAAQGRYKLALHRAIWGSAALLSALIVLRVLLMP